MKTVCIMCPVGCSLEIEKEKDNIIVKGNLCPRGESYGKSEITCPKRVITTVVKGKGKIISVKTSEAVPKEKIEEVLKEIAKIVPTSCKIGDILIKNVLQTGADIVVTGESN